MIRTEHVELPGGGFDTVFASANGFVLPAEVEGLELLGAALDATSNELGNVIVGSDGANSLSGVGGDDTVSGADGADTIDGGAGDDTLAGERGADSVLGGAGDDELDGGDGNDVLSAGDGNDLLIGGFDDDTLLGGAGNDVFEDGAGNDLMSGGAGDDRINFARVLLPGETVGDGNDTLDGGVGNDSLFSGAGDDLVLGGAGDDQLFGGNGIDTVEGGAGVDRIDGGAGSDVLIGGLGADVIFGAGFDRFVYRAAAESTAQAADTIGGFDAAGGAVIDLSAIDAIRGGADNAFVFIGGAAFTAAGQVRVVASGIDARVEANLDADLATAELAIAITGVFGFFDNNTFTCKGG